MQVNHLQRIKKNTGQFMEALILQQMQIIISVIWFGKGKVVGTTLDGKVVADIAGRNVIFENGKQNTISVGS